MVASDAARQILLIGPEAVCEPIAARLRERPYQVRIALSSFEALWFHKEEGADLVIILLPVQDCTAPDLVRRLKAQDPRVIFVICGRDEQTAGAPDALDLGAFDYVSNPLNDLPRLLSIVGVGLGARWSDAQLRFLRAKDATGSDWQTIVSASPQMRRALITVRQICHRTMKGPPPTILVTGETGTGKGLVAKMIHYNSCRRSGAFVDVNCAALPPTLIEAELFGFARGAFTDAKAAKPGLFETADRGTLFLDEVSSLPLELQGKLLTAIEEKTVRRIGTSAGVPVDVQIIAATHTDLDALVAEQSFRIDLFHRLNVLRIDLPPLRERGSDRVQLATTFIRELCQQYGLPAKELSEDARRAIEEYHWPGNVRELRNQIERIVMLEETDTIQARHFTFPRAAGASVAVAHADGGLVVQLPDETCPLEQLEREVIRQALERHGGNVSRTARYLQISRYTLMYRMKKHASEGAEGAAEELAEDEAPRR